MAAVTTSVAAAAMPVLMKSLPTRMARFTPMVRVAKYYGSTRGCTVTGGRRMGTILSVGGVEGSNHWDGTTEVAQAEWTDAAPSEDGTGVEQQSGSGSTTEQPYYSPPPPSSARRRQYYDNDGRLLNFIAMGRAMQLALDGQKEFEMFLDKCNAFGVMLPENPSDVKRNLCELDPKETWIVVDSRAVLKFAKKLALEEADRNKGDYPEGFVEDMLNRDKYGRYNSDDEDY